MDQAECVGALRLSAPGGGGVPLAPPQRQQGDAESEEEESEPDWGTAEEPETEGEPAQKRPAAAHAEEEPPRPMEGAFGPGGSAGQPDMPAPPAHVEEPPETGPGVSAGPSAEPDAPMSSETIMPQEGAVELEPAIIGWTPGFSTFTGVDWQGWKDLIPALGDREGMPIIEVGREWRSRSADGLDPRVVSFDPFLSRIALSIRFGPLRGRLVVRWCPV